jgi:hypothetical protein
LVSSGRGIWFRGTCFKFCGNCVPGAPFENLDVPLGSRQQKHSENVIWGRMNIGEGHQGGRGPYRKAGMDTPLSSSPTGSSEQHHKRHKARNAPCSSDMSIHRVGVSEYVGDDPQMPQIGLHEKLTNCLLEPMGVVVGGSAAASDAAKPSLVP